MHKDVFDIGDISLVEAERDVIVNRAIASGLVPVRLDGETKEMHDARKARVWQRLVGMDLMREYWRA